MDKSGKSSPNKLQIIRRVHGLLGSEDIEKSRQSQDYLGTILGKSKDLCYDSVDIEGMHGEWVSVDRAHMKKTVILHCHGGGYSTGSSVYARTLTSKLAMSTLMRVLCFDYRLAPEFPYPAALDDAMKAWNYLMLLGYGAKDVIITGDSAGGNLALSLVLKLKEEGRILPKGILLMSPWTDMTCTGDSFLDKVEWDPVLSPPYIYKMIKAYAGNHNVRDPYISTLFGDFTDFPPTYIQVGEHEILLDDATRLAKKMEQAGACVRLDVFPEMWHVFQMTPFKTAYDAMDKNAEFIYNL